MLANQDFYRRIATTAVNEFVEKQVWWLSYSNFYKFVKSHREEVINRLTDYLMVTEDGTIYDREKIITALDTSGTLLSFNILDILKVFRRGDLVRQASGLGRTFHELGFVQVNDDGTRPNNRLTLIGEDNCSLPRQHFFKIFGRKTTKEGAKCNDYWEIDLHKIYIFCVYAELSGLRLVRHDYHKNSQTRREKNDTVIHEQPQPIIWHVSRAEYGYHGYPTDWTQSINEALENIPYTTYNNLNLKTKAGETIDTLDCRIAYGIEFEVGSRLIDNQIFQIDLMRNDIKIGKNISSIRMHDGSLGGGTETIFVPASADNFIYIMETMSTNVEQMLSPSQRTRDIVLASTHTTMSILFPDDEKGRAIASTRIKNSTFQARLLVIMDTIKDMFTPAEIVRLFGRYFTGYAEAPTPDDLGLARSNEQSRIDRLTYIHSRAASVHGLRSESSSRNAGRDNGASMYELRLPNRKCNPYFIRDFGFLTMLLDYNYFDKANLYSNIIRLCIIYLED